MISTCKNPDAKTPLYRVFLCLGYICDGRCGRGLTRGGALWVISRLADCAPSVTYKSTLPRVLVAKRDIPSQCIRRLEHAVFGGGAVLLCPPIGNIPWWGGQSLVFYSCSNLRGKAF